MISLGVLGLEHPHAGSSHLPALLKLTNDIRVTAIAEPDKEKALPWVKRFGCGYYDDYRKMLEVPAIDAVLITSRNCQHAQHTIDAANAGKDVLCDKPIATAYSDAVKMVEACREGNVIFITTLPLRFNPQIKKLKERVKNDGLGRIDAVMATNHGCMYKPKTPDWVKNPKQNGGGCIIDHTIHVADIIRWVTGQEFETVKTEAQTSFHDIEAEDVAVLTGKLSSDAIYQIDCSWSRLERDPAWGDVTFRVVGSKGAASLDVYNNRRIEVYKEKTIEFRYLDYIREDHRQIFINYLHHKEKGAPLIAADGFDGLKTMELAAAAYDSLKIRDFVKVPENFCPDKNLSKCKN